LTRSLGRVGVWLGGLSWQPAVVAREAVAELEELGYGAVWVGEVQTAKEVFSHAGLLLSAGKSIVVATGIASIWARDPMAMSTGAKTLGEAYPGRFVLGIGVSHPHVVAARGQVYERPVARMRRYLEEMDAAEYHGPEPAEPVTRLLAALRPPMLRLAAELADGAHPYFVPVEHTARARELLGRDALLAPEQAILLERDPDRARRVAREHTSFYLTAPNYSENLRSLGWDPEDFAEGGTDALVDALVAWGDEAAIRARVEAHLAAGADHVCIQPLAPRGEIDLAPLRALAPALAGL
jgi:probable F420-dependent oxidoreductase